MIKNRFVLIDAFALIHRAFHAIPPLTKDGQQMNAVYGFTSALLNSIKELEPEYLAVGFDLPKPTFRKKEYVEYKAHRAKAPDELISQIPYVREVLNTFNIPIICAEGYEGEDAIATAIAKIRSTKSEARNKSEILNNKNSNSFEFRDSNFEFIVVTGDMDTLQLIDGQTKVYSMARGINQAVMYDEEKVIERYGLKPSEFVDFKALKGDPSDNIPGVPGIGEKGAAKLIQDYKNLNNIYKNIEKISGKNKTLLKENKDQAYLSQKLSKIACDAPIDFELSNAKIHNYDKEKVIALFNNLGFKSLIPRLHAEEIKIRKKDTQPRLL